jgi:hypothetical protein
VLLVLRRCEDILRGFGDEASAGDVIDFAGVFEDLEGEVLLGGDSLDFLDDILGGGLGGKGESPFFFFCFFSIVISGVFDFPSPFTVEFDEDEVRDSCNDGKP